MIATTISHYRVLEKLGEGGMGVVYKAEDVRLDRFVALKFLPESYADDLQVRERFLREARAASALNHPNICTIHDIGEEDGQVFLAMEFLDGETLREIVERGPLPLDRLINLALQALEGLEAAHGEGIVHRDISLGNLFVTKSGRLKILDFGLAKRTKEKRRQLVPVGHDGDEYDPHQTSGLAALGTMAYMSPEQALGQSLDTRTDLFSFGVVLYEMATGRAPFQGDTTGMLFLSIVQEKPQPVRELNADIPEDLQRIIGKCLEKDRNLRYQHAADIRADLTRLQQESSLLDIGSGAVALQMTHPTIELAAATPGQSAVPTPGAANSATVQHPTAQAEPPITDEKASEAPPKILRQRTAILGAAALVLVLAVGGLLYWRSHRVIRLTDKDTIVVADFTNTTGDPIFDHTLRQGLASQLEQSPFLSLVADDRIAQTLTLMTKPKDSRLTNQLSREVCQRVGGKATLEGSIAGLGSPYTLELKAVDCQSGDTLVEVNRSAEAKDQVLLVLAGMSAKMRQKLGESLASVQKYDAPADDITTPSLEALQSYSLGYHAMKFSGDWKPAIQFLQRAIEQDPNFASAYQQLAVAYFNMGDVGSAAENARKAYELRERASQHERYSIEAKYEQIANEDFVATRRVLEAWQTAYPRDNVPLVSLSVVYAMLGDLQNRQAAIQQSMRLDLINSSGYANLANSYIELNRLDEAKATIKEAQARGLDSPTLHRSLYGIAFQEQDSAAMEHEADVLMSKSVYTAAALYLESETAAYGGQISRARELVERAADASKRNGRADAVPSWMIQAALREALMGNLAFAKQQVEAAIQLGCNKGCEAVAATVFAMAGDPARAQRMADGLNSRFPKSTPMQYFYLPILNSTIALANGNPAKAVEASAVAAPYELGYPPNLNFLRVYPVYFRGQAFLAARQGTQAAAEFQKILDNSGLVWNEPIGALAHLGLGRAYAIAGNTAQAKTAYQDFFVLWKDADPDVPILKQAKTEYAKLQ